MSNLFMWKADIFAFQETKVLKLDQRLRFPNYYDYWSFCETGDGSSPQSGTVCFCKYKPIAVYTKFFDDSFDTEGRLLTLEFDRFYFINCYVPQTQDAVTAKNDIRSLERREYREKWDRMLREYVCELNEVKPVILCGDFNASVSSLDMSPNSSWQDDEGGFSKDVNAQLRKITESGFTDTYRVIHPKEKGAYTHWHMRDKNRETSPGRRLDYFFVSDELAEDIEDANVFPNVTGSDHCPVYLKINLSRPVLRNEDTSNLTYYYLLQREASHVYYTCGVAGLTGNLYAETGLRANNLQNSYEKKLNITDAEYTRLVDENAGWGRLKSGAGWIVLDYCQKV